MPLTEEIRQAAEKLGSQLGADPSVREYVNLVVQSQQDTELVDLEEKAGQLYQKLIERQQNGEVVDQADINEYYNLKGQVQDHLLIASREDRLEAVKAVFAQTAQRITSVLGIEYTTFAR